MSNSVRPHRRQPTRLPGPWDSPGKNTGVGCHFLLQCMKVKTESEVAQSCPTLSDPMDCSLPGSLSMVFSRQEHWSGLPLPSLPSCSTQAQLLHGMRDLSSPTRDQTCVPCIEGRFLPSGPPRESLLFFQIARLGFCRLQSEEP